MKFKDLVIPNKLQAENSTKTDVYAKFYAEPFEAGYGHTIGNSLRRILLSSLEGTAITSIKIKGVSHEFAVLPGVLEDVMQIILNLKKVRLKCFSDDVQKVYLKAKGKGEVTAKDIELNSNLEIINEDLVIAHLEPNGNLDMEITIEKGRGYLSDDRRDKTNLPANTIAIDAIFTPVTRVNYEIENARVGNITDYDRLVLEVWTDGSVIPEDAVAYSAKILKDSMNIFINFEDTEPIVGVDLDTKKEDNKEEDENDIDSMLTQDVDVIELSVRSANCLRNAKIATIYELVTKKEDDLLNYKNFGKKSLDEIKDKLHELGLDLGMSIPKK